MSMDTDYESTIDSDDVVWTDADDSEQGSEIMDEDNDRPNRVKIFSAEYVRSKLDQFLKPGIPLLIVLIILFASLSGFVLYTHYTKE